MEDYRCLIEQREQELAALRAETVKRLEAEAAQTGEELAAARGQLAALHADFDYNLQLLAGRDEELARFEEAVRTSAAELAAKAHLLEQMQQGMADAERALAQEHEARVAADGQLAKHQRTLLQELARVKAAGEAAAQRMQHEAEEQHAALQGELERRAAVAAEQQCQQQAAHDEQLQLLRDECAQSLRRLQAQAERAEQQFHRLDADYKAEQQRLQERQAELMRSQAELSEQRRQAERASASLAHAERERDALAQQLREQQQEQGLLVGELQRTVSALRNALEDHQAESAEELRRVRTQHTAQLAAAQQDAAAAAAAGQAALAGELEEARAALEVQHAALQQQLEGICSEREARCRELEGQLQQQRQQHAEDVRQLHVAAVQVQGELQALQERHAALQDFAEQQQEELGECRTNLAAARTRCIDVQVQLETAERRVAVLAAGQGPSLEEWEGMLRRVTEQRDHAQAAKQEAQRRLAVRELELQQLRSQQREAGMLSRLQHEPSNVGFSWPADLSDGSVVLKAGEGGGPKLGREVADLQHALQAERHQSQQLQAALRTLSAEMQQLQQQQRALPASAQHGSALCAAEPAGALADLTNRGGAQNDRSSTSAAEVQRLRKQLGRAQAGAQQLAAENERLMELSNGLRAERNRLVAAQPSCSGSAEASSTQQGNGAAVLCGGAAAQQAAWPPTAMLPPMLWQLLARQQQGAAAATAVAAAQQQQQLPWDEGINAECSSSRSLPCTLDPCAALGQAVHPAALPTPQQGTLSAIPNQLAVVGVQVPEAQRPQRVAAPPAPPRPPQHTGEQQHASPKVRNYALRSEDEETCHNNL